MIEKIIGNQIGDSNKVQDSTPRTYLCDKTEGKYSAVPQEHLPIHGTHYY